MRTLFALIVMLWSGASLATAGQAQPPDQVSIVVQATDPVAGGTIATGGKLYLKLDYESPVPVRFLVEAIRQEVVQEKAFGSTTPPYESGRGAALVWIGFPVPVRVDELRVTAYDIGWHQIGQVTTPLVVTWSAEAVPGTRRTADWVGPLERHHRRIFDTTYDPQPEKPDLLFDVFFLASLISVPFYLALQVRMLVRYRGEWRTYAMGPLLAILPLCLYSVIGLGLEPNYWAIFLFRFFPLSFCYLSLLWGARWYVDRRHHTVSPHLFQ